jgi:glycosyltransferase involved in cell wall biosynthesis
LTEPKRFGALRGRSEAAVQDETSDHTATGERTRILALFGSAAIFGAERGNLEPLLALKAQGAEILCLIRDEAWSTMVPPALDVRGITWRKVPYVEQWRRSRIHVVLFRGPWAWIVANWCFLKAVRTFKPTHIHSYSQLFTVNFLLGLMLVRTPLVFRAGDEPTCHNAFWRATWRYVVKRTSQFVANSRFVASSLVRYGADKRQISLIYNAPPSRPGLGTAGRPLPAADRNNIAYVGQISEHKGPHLLIEAFKSIAKEFPNAQLTLAGRIDALWEGDAWARALRNRTIADEQLRDRVRFLGNIEDTPVLYATSSFVVVPSIFEDPAPNVVMEAKQAGRAVIGFPRGGIPELIEHGVDGLVCAEAGVPALIAALRRYLNDPDLAHRHGEAAKLSLERFEIREFGQKWRAVYRAAVASPAERSSTPAHPNKEAVPECSTADPPTCRTGLRNDHHASGR